MQFFDKIHVRGIVINKAVTMVGTGLVIRTHVKALSSVKLLLWLVLAWSSGHSFLTETHVKALSSMKLLLWLELA